MKVKEPQLKLKTKGISGGRRGHFSTEVGGKWILMGEHSVLQGTHSIALPLPQLSLKLFASRLTSQKVKGRKQLLDRGLEGVRRRIITQTGIDLENYEIKIDNRVPIGAGLGSSAALSVALSRFVKWLKPELPLSECDLAQEIENEFHGKSSGMDVAVVSSSKPILFRNRKVLDVLECEPFSSLMAYRAPIFTLHWTGRPKSTKDAIQRVQEWRERNPSKACQWDAKIDQATQKTWEALKVLSSELPLSLRNSSDHLSTPAFSTAKQRKNFSQKIFVKQLNIISRSVELAYQSFEEWGLVPSDLLSQRQELLSQGAKAVKLTGAGLGGYWVAVWDPDLFQTAQFTSAEEQGAWHVSQLLRSSPTSRRPLSSVGNQQSSPVTEILVDRPLAGF